MANIPTITYVLDAIGAVGVIIGGYVASKSVYSSATSKQAALLIDTQGKRIDSLEETISNLTQEIHKYREENNKMMGELAAYKKMALISPDVMSKLATAIDGILTTLQNNGVHINTQTVDTQVIKETK